MLNDKSNSNPIVEMKNIKKYFGHIKALDDVDFEINPQEILALVGDNGAGKSTLIKILSGFILPDEGSIYMNGKKVKIENPNDSIKLGIGTVYQDLAIVDCLNVASNIFIGREPLRARVFVNRNKMFKESEEILYNLKIKIDSVRQIAGYLSGGQRQSLAVGRVISMDCDIFVLDEPTAALGVRESGEVLKLIKDLKDQGKSIVIISHNLAHVFSISDRFVVLRQGKIIGKRLAKETTTDEIVSMITGAYELKNHYVN
ncbi:MAG: ATP-binding cassette domain-containing protein [Actinobacteria bacterium]|nr:ATP-binding cassette domain-containing protein [Actinomycetota bacterium]MCL6088462.1 ATP-binding cassette domain-containing protein [Actinomycetota bacterium]